MQVDYYLAQLLADHCVLGSANCTLEVAREWCCDVKTEVWKRPRRGGKNPWVPVDVVGFSLVERDWMKGNQDLKLRRLTGSSKSNWKLAATKTKVVVVFSRKVFWQVRIGALACCDIQVTWSPTFWMVLDAFWYIDSLVIMNFHWFSFSISESPWWFSGSPAVSFSTR